MQKFLFLAVVAALVAPAPALAAADADALASDVLARNNRIIDQLAAAKGGGITAEEALKIIQAEMSPVLNFEKITRRAMGKNWKKADDAARTGITSAFRALLENTYAKVLTKYKNQKVKLLETSTLANGNVSVLVEVLGDTPVSINYIFSPAAKDSEEFLISDIKVEKISLIANYRRQFKSLIAAGGMDGLVKKLEALANKKAQ